VSAETWSARELREHVDAFVEATCRVVVELNDSGSSNPLVVLRVHHLTSGL
jgi:hypothetical protein